MRQAIDRLLFAHPRAVNEGYLQHAGVALGFAFGLIGAGLAALVHAFVPCLFEKTASASVKRMYARMTRREQSPATAD